MFCRAVSSSSGWSVPAGQVIEVLDAHDRRDLLRLRQLLGVHHREPEVPDQPLGPQRGQLRELLRERARHRRVPVVPAADPQVDGVEGVDPEPLQVVVHLLAQVGRGPREHPAAGGVAHRADLGDDAQVIRVRRERLADDLVGDVRPVEVGRVDVVDAELDRGAEHGDRLGPVGRRPEDPGAGQLHRAEPDPGDGLVAQLECAAGERRGSSHVRPIPFKGLRASVNARGPGADSRRVRHPQCPARPRIGSAPIILGVTGPG